MVDENALASWDTSALIEGEVKWRHQENPERGKDELFEDVAGNSYFFDQEWEYLCDYLTELMQERGMTDRPLHCTVENFGWRALDGEKTFWAETGAEFLKQVLPDTDCTFHIYGHEQYGLEIQNFHHDSPTGKEQYYIEPIETELVIPVLSREEINTMLDAIGPLEEFNGVPAQPGSTLIRFAGKGATHGRLQVFNGGTEGYPGPHVRIALCNRDGELDWVFDDWLAEEYYLVGHGAEYTIKIKEAAV